MYVLINMPEWKYKSIVEGVAAGKRCNCPNEMVPAASIIADGIAIPNVPGDILIISEKYVKEHMLDMDAFVQKFIGEVDLANATIRKAPECKED